ncbi:MAG: CusA/CzcA family heavy metal efflux RND transporter [Planctomycetales bacterium]
MAKPMVYYALANRSLIMVLTVAIALAGLWSFQQQTIDAYPDISSQVVMVITTFPGRAPEEVEQQVTIPIELAMGSVPRLDLIRSRSIFGLSVVELIFTEGTEGYFARQRVQERLVGVPLPKGASAELGPFATAYGEILRYQLEAPDVTDQIKVRTINDWVVIPRVKRIAGVADVVNFGGRAKQYTLTIDPVQLERYELSLDDVMEAVRVNNSNAGGSLLQRGEMSFVIRGRGAFLTKEDLANTVINTIDGTPVYLGDVADVTLEGMLPSGIFSKDDREEGVEGIVMLRRGENPSRILRLVKAEIEELNRDPLMEGIRITPFYDRTYLVDKTLHTVSHSIILGISLVVLVLLAFLGSPIVAALVVLTIPFSLLFALVLMYLTGIPIGLLSIGAIDFGILVDGAVIIADNMARRLSVWREKGGALNSLEVVRSAVAEVERPVLYSMLMIVFAYLPLLSMTSIEGLLFRPMAITIVYALIGATVFGMIVLPVLGTYLFRRGYVEIPNPVMELLKVLYGRALRVTIHLRWFVLPAVFAGLIAFSFWIWGRLGTEFLPYLDEGVVWIRANFPEGTSLAQTSLYGKKIRGMIRAFPECDFVSAQAGRNDTGTDPFPPSRLEMMVGLKPQAEWRFARKQELIAELGRTLRLEFPTTRFNFTQPIIDSVTEVTNGTSANLAVEFAGDDSTELLKLARQTQQLLRGIRGATDVNIEQEGPQPQLIITPDRELCARYDVKIESVSQLVNVELGGEPVGTMFEGARRFDIVARFDREFLHSQEAIERLPVHSALSSVPIPLSQVARFSVDDGQTVIARESPHRRITVRCDITGRDQGGFVEEAKEKFKGDVTIPATVRVRWIGMFENLERAAAHFRLLIPVSIGLIYILLVAVFHCHRKALIVIFSIPFALVGGVLALYLRGMNLNVSSGVGFAALFGVSIMNAVVLVEWISDLTPSMHSQREAIIQGSVDRLRSVLMSSLVAILGLLPASLATDLGSDVQRPLATVIVWGLTSSTILSLFIVPALYAVMGPKRRPGRIRVEEEDGEEAEG